MFLVAIAVLGLLAFHYVPYYNGARSALDSARQLAAEARNLQASDINRPTLERLHAEVSALQQNVVATQGLRRPTRLWPWRALCRPWPGS